MRRLNCVCVLLTVCMMASWGARAQDWQSPFVSDSNTIALWHFDSTPVLDDSENGFDLSQVSYPFLTSGDPGLRGTFSGFGEAAQFVGAGYWEIADHDLLDLGAEGPFTIEFWLKTSSRIPGATIISKWYDNSSRSWNFQFSGTGQIVFGVSQDGTNNTLVYAISQTIVDDGDWHHVALCWDAEKVNGVVLFVDGIAESILTPPIPTINANTAPVKIGAAWSGAMQFLGYIDEFRISNNIRYETGPQICGDLGTVYLSADLSMDCRVDLLDFVLMAENWMGCTNPEDSGCDGFWRE